MNIRYPIYEGVYRILTKNGLHARLLRGIRPEGVEIARKTCKVKPCYLSVFPRRFAKK